MGFSAKKSCLLRFGPRYMRHCEEITLNGNPICYVNTAKYLGVMLRSGKCFGSDLQHNKSHFYLRFNTIFHQAAKLKNEIIMLHLVSTYCKPYLLYGSECLGLGITQQRSLSHTWQCAISHIFHLNGADVNLVSNYTANLPFMDMLVVRHVRFLFNLSRSDNAVLSYMFRLTALSELNNVRVMCTEAVMKLIGWMYQHLDGA
jgi:hypothetical protein